MSNTPSNTVKLQYFTPPHVSAPKRITLSHLQKLKAKSEKIAMLTAYDAMFAKLFSDVGIEILLVGDSLGMTVQGHSTTVPVKIEDIVYHTQNVVRACPVSLILSDLPFMAYPDIKTALKNAAKLMQAGAEMVKIEGGEWLVPIVEKLTQQGIPVCTHIGLTPQSVHVLGGYKIQGREQEQARTLLETALAHEKAGAKLIVLECMPHLLAAEITQAVSIPTIGIGAGNKCDGQVLVMHDMLGLSPGKPLKFVKNFLSGKNHTVQEAIEAYIHEVKSGAFPAEEYSFS